MRWLLIAAGLCATATVPPSTAETVTSTSQSGSPVLILTLPGGANRFSSYDFRQDDFGGVDWPVEFVFRGNATVEGIKRALCHETTSAWKYCDAGGPMYLFDGPAATTDVSKQFVADAGIKRFNENCATNGFTAHIRLYALHPPKGSTAATGSAVAAQDDAKVVGTVHLDFEDAAGCSGRIHGYPDVAEQWFIDAMRAIPGWMVTPDAWNLGNASKPFVIMRELAGVEVPHVYGHDGLATDVVIP